MFSTRNITRRAMINAPLPLTVVRFTKAQTKPKDDINALPKNPPVPVDDGACKHLPGLAVPSMRLWSTGNRWVNLAEMKTPRTVVYAYPRTGKAGQEPPPGWN